MEQMNSDWFNDWRSDCPKIQDGNGHLLATGIYSDVTFIIEEDDGHPSPIISRIKAHQFILKTRSPVFDTMFNEIWTQETKAHNNNGINVKRIGQIGDKTNKSTNGLEIKIVDTTREYFEAFLKVNGLFVIFNILLQQVFSQFLCSSYILITSWKVSLRNRWLVFYIWLINILLLHWQQNVQVIWRKLLP